MIQPRQLPLPLLGLPPARSAAPTSPPHRLLEADLSPWSRRHLHYPQGLQRAFDVATVLDVRHTVVARQAVVPGDCATRFVARPLAAEDAGAALCAGGHDGRWG